MPGRRIATSTFEDVESDCRQLNEQLGFPMFRVRREGTNLVLDENTALKHHRLPQLVKHAPQWSELMLSDAPKLTMFLEGISFALWIASQV
jgi:hypothetical protein